MDDEGTDAARTIDTRCCIAGGGPAGMMAGMLLARAGVEVVVLEKHADFLRDFRGDTIHPSTLEIFHELGLLEAFLARPHQRAEHISAMVGEETIPVADFTHLPTHCRFIALMPQWDFLDFVSGQAARYPTFRLEMRAEVTDLLEREGTVAGVRARTPGGPLEVRADLVIGADGRHSTVRARSGLEVETLGAPMDVLWMRIARRPDDPAETFGRFDRGTIMVLIQRGDYWQCGFVIPKGGGEAIRAEGIEALRERIVRAVPMFRDRIGELAGFDDVSLLTVAVDRLTCWHRPGLLCIGDAAHAMSPIGGVGVNLAVQDAVAAANRLAAPLRGGAPGPADLGAVEARRRLPTRLTQRFQIAVQNRVIGRIIASDRPLAPPLPLRLLRRWALLRRIPARMIGLGVRPEHVASPEAAPAGTR